MTDLAEIITAFAPQAESDPAAMIRLATLLRQDGEPDRALALCRKGLALAPEDARVASLAREFLSRDVPPWHFGIVHDAVRNAAYDAALRRAIRPGSRVLEIGTGSGLLAMMAARAGAAEVISCEMNPTIADMARRIIAQNGFADRVRIIAKHSDALDVDADLGGPVDVLVSEIVSNDMLRQNVLPVHERAAAMFLKPGGHVIPTRGTVRVALAEDPDEDRERLGEIDGFDLSAFNALRLPEKQIPVGKGRPTLRSDAKDLFKFDFGAGPFPVAEEASVICRAGGGRCNGIVQWIELEMDDEIRYENRPVPGATSCWALVFHSLSEPVQLSPGQAVRVSGSHNQRRISIWLDTAESPQSPASAATAGRLPRS